MKRQMGLRLEDSAVRLLNRLRSKWAGGNLRAPLGTSEAVEKCIRECATRELGTDTPGGDL